MHLDEAIDQLEQEIRELKIQFERFFNGALPVPPDELRQQAFKHLRRLRSQHLRSLATRFRLNSLEARLNSLNELFNRRLREFEQSGERHPLHDPSRHRDFDPYAGIVLEGGTGRRGVEVLYQELYGANGRRSKTDLESFHAFLRREEAKIRKKTGCNRVQFRVASDGGKLKLKARSLPE